MRSKEWVGVEGQWIKSNQARAWWVVGHDRRGGEPFVMGLEHR